MDSSVFAAYTQYFLICTLILAVAYLLGSLIKSFLFIQISNDNLDKSVRLFFGLLLMISAFALIVTGFQSIFIIVLIVFLFYLLSLKKTKKWNRLDIKYNFEVGDLILLLCLFFLNAFYLIPHNGNLYPGYFGDYFFYSDVADSLLNYKTENIFRSSNTILPTIYSPYHYFDIWFTALLSFFSKKASIVLYLTVVSTLLQLLLSWTILSFFKTRKTYVYLLVIIFFASNFKSIVPLELFSSFIPILSAYAKYHSFELLIKSLPCIVVFLYILYIYINRKGYLYVPFLCSLLLVFNIANVFFAAYILLFHFIIYHSKCQKNIIALFAAILSFIFVPLFYFYISSEYKLDTFFSIEKLNVTEIVLAIKMSIGVIFAFTAFYFPILLIVLYYLHRSKQFIKSTWKIAISFILLFFSILLTASFIHIFQKDGMQFFTNTAWVVLGTILFMVFVKCVQLLDKENLFFNKSIPLKIGIYILFLAVVYYKLNTNIKRSVFYGQEQVDQNYLHQIKEVLEKDQSQLIRVGSFFKEEDYLKDHKVFYSFNPLGSYLKLLSPNVEVLNLTSYEMHLFGPNDYVRKTANLDFATVFIKQQTSHLPTFNESVDYIHLIMKKYNLKYLIFSDDQVMVKYRFASYLKKNDMIVKKKIENTKYGETFYVLEQ